MYIADGGFDGTAKLYSLNTLTGAISPRPGSLDSNGMASLASLDELPILLIPEPTTLAITLLGVALASCHTRRRAR
jgi:hypothetical protein